ncbi:MAG: DoxX family protein [Gammaproteobacteria bacterium]|nr:DoxX family protein [Gammaproteobacteria bacterium]
MNKIIGFCKCAQHYLIEKSRALDFTAPLLLRIYLAPIFIIAGWNKLSDLESTAYYFGEYLGMPLPELMAFLAGSTEFFGGIAILIGLATRWASLPLIFTMFIAAVTAHWGNGWHVLPESTLTMPWEWRTDLIEGAAARKEMAISILRTHGNIEWLTETGGFTILKNGIEFAATYLIMLLSLFYLGAGKASADHFIQKHFNE